MTAPEWLTSDEAAAALRLHVATIRERIRRGFYPADKIDRSTGRIRIRF